MYIYERGIVGAAVRQKIENTKNSIVNGAEKDSTPFSAIMKSMMTNVDAAAENSEVSADSPQTSASSSASALDASTLLYYMQNTDNASITDLMGAYTNTGLRTAASELQTDSRALLDGLTAENLSAFTDKYNALVSTLKTSGNSSSLLYLNALETYVTAELPQLSAAGISKAGGYELTYSGETDETAQLASLVSGITTVTTQIVASTSSLSDSMGSYYSSLIGTML